MSEVSRQRRWRRRVGAALTIGSAVVSVGVVGAVDAGADAPLDALSLSCEGRDRDVASVRCRWTVPADAAGVRVVRVTLGSGEGRIVVHRTDDPSMNTFVDAPVRRGVRYMYAVRAVDSSGDLIAASRPVVAGVRPADDGIEALRLDCNATGSTVVRCRWTNPETADRTLTLWRSVDGTVRERVASFDHRFATSYGDTVLANTSSVVYAVIATDGSGEIVARSRADLVQMPSNEVSASEQRPVGTAPIEESVPDVVIPDVIASEVVVKEPAELVSTTTTVATDEVPVAAPLEPVVPERIPEVAASERPEPDVDHAEPERITLPADGPSSLRSNRVDRVRTNSEAETAR
jgi:hypothetical protein